MLLSVVTVAFRNYDGVVNTWRSLRNLARDPSLTFEWIVVDGGSDDGTAQFLEKLNGEFNKTRARHAECQKRRWS